jgi:glycerophosphoryl diester phosphodiesterase
VFSDFADTAVAARVMFRLARDPGYARCLVRDNGCTDRD